MRSILALIIGLPLLLLGAQWQSLNGPPAGKADDMCMGWDPEWNYWVIYAADQTHKLYKSTDEGEYWDSLPPPEYPNPNIVNPVCVICEPNNAQVVYIGKNGATPVWKSVNGGETWEPKSYGITNTYPLCFAMDPINSSIIYLGCKKDGNKPVLFRTTDGGFYWEKLNISNYDINDILVLFFIDEGIVLILATDKGILRGKPYCDFELVKEGDFKLLKYDKKSKKIFAKGSDKIYQSTDGKEWKVYNANDPIDFTGISDIIKWR